MQGVSQVDMERWEELVNALITWAHWKRPAGEREAFRALAAASQTDPVLRERVQAMGMTIAESYIEEGYVKGRLSASREILRRLLTARFGPLPEALLRKIAEASDPARLQAALDQVIQISRLEELDL